MTSMKIIIPMAGIGKRLEQLTQRKPKALVRLADKRLLDHVLDTFQGLEKMYSLEYIFIVGYLGHQIQGYMRDAHPDKIVKYFVQEELKGQAHAVYLAKDAISGPILLTYCDTINEIDLSFLASETMDGVAGVQEVDDPRSHGVALVGPGNLIMKLVEKPKTMEHRSALTGLYYFSEGKELIKAIETQIQRETSLNNEYYLADAINILVENGMRIRVENVVRWLDAGMPEALIETNAYLLRQCSKAHLEMKTVQSNIIVPPVYIHESSRVENSIIGPNVTIGKHCSIRASIIQNTIIDDDSSVTDVSLNNSLVGVGCSVTGDPAKLLVADSDEKRVFYSMDERLGGE